MTHMRKKSESCIQNTYIGNKVKDHNEDFDEHNHTTIKTVLPHPQHTPAQQQFMAGQQAPVAQVPVVQGSKWGKSTWFGCFMAIVAIFILLFIFWYIIFNCWKPDFCCCKDKDRKAKGKKDCWRILCAAFVVTVITLIFFWLLYYCFCKE